MSYVLLRLTIYIIMTYQRGSRQRYPEIECQYELQETLGSGELILSYLTIVRYSIIFLGGFAKVKAAVHKVTGEKV